VFARLSCAPITWVGWAHIRAERRTFGGEFEHAFALEAWAQKEKIGITLASTLNKQTIKAYDFVFPMLVGRGGTRRRAPGQS